MPVLKFDSVQVDVDDDGFLENPDVWNEKVALALASTDNIQELNEQHWALINYLRDYFQKNGNAPMIRRLCKESGYTLKQIYELFPSGPAKGACKVAGLTKPTGCV